MIAQMPSLPPELFRKIVDEARDAVVVVDTDGRYVLVNPAAAKFYGVEPGDMIGRLVGGFSADAQGTLALVGAFQGKSEHRGEHRIYRPDGTAIDVEYTATAQVLPGLHLAILRDVTATKHLAWEQEHTARRYRELFANASDVVYTVDMNGVITEVNGAIGRVLGYTQEELLGKRFSFLMPPDQQERGTAMRSAILADEHGTASEELTLIHRDGHLVETEISARLMLCGKDTPAGIHGIVRDISERKRLERELRITAERYQELFEEASDVIFTMDLGGNLLQLNGASERLFGWRGEELAGRNIRELMPPAYWSMLASPEERMSRNPGDVVVRQYEMIGKYGALVSVEVTSRVVWRDGQPVAVHGVARDISERLESERKILESEARFRAVMNALPCGVWVWDGSTVTFVNPAMAEIAGCHPDELFQDETNSFIAIFEPEDAEMMRRYGQERLEGGTPPTRYEVRLRRPGGEIRWLDVHCTLVSQDGHWATVSTAFDVTERHLAELERQEFDARMQHTQKLESLGVLAGGVAHDFNNLLVGIMGNAELAMIDLTNRDLLEDTLTQIRTAAQRAGELTRQLLAYSGKGKFVVEPTDLSALVREMRQLVDVSTSKHARVHVDAPEGLPTVAADAGQLRQVAMNLIINASDALGDAPGDIWVRTGTVELDAAAAAAICPAGNLPPGCYVMLEVRDTGCGMDGETRQRLFEPFFTTKFTGRGLGLAAVQGIVRSHRGAIRVESEPGEGATFTVVLPVHDGPGDIGAQVADGLADGQGWRGQGRVLVVDDDDVVRAVVVRMLRNAGFEVEAVPDGFQALDAMERAPQDFALAVVDLTMPGMDGGATLDRLRAMNQGLPAVVISGFAEQEATERVRFDGRTSFVQKPFAQADLLRTIETMIRAQHS